MKTSKFNFISFHTDKIIERKLIFYNTKHSIMPQSIGLREKLSKKNRNSQSFENTQVIYLDREAEEDFHASPYASKYYENEKWFERYQIRDIKKNNLLNSYKGILQILSSEVASNPDKSIRQNIKEALNKFYSNSASTQESQIQRVSINRTKRKEIFRRLCSLLDSFEVFFELLGDEEIRRMHLGNSLNLRLYKSGGKIQHKELFYLEEENILFRSVLEKYIRENSKSGVCLIQSTNISVFIEKKLVIEEGDSDKLEFELKPVKNQNVNLLDLIRAKVFSPLLSKKLSSIIKEKMSGLIISGVTNSAKSYVLSGLISSISNQRVPLVVGSKTRLSISHPNSKIISAREFENLIIKYDLEELASEISKIGITDIFIDDFFSKYFPLVNILCERYSIYPVICLNGILRSNINYLIKIPDGSSFLSNYASIVLDLGEVSDEKSLKGLYEISTVGDKIKFLNISEKDNVTGNWLVSDSSCEESRFFSDLLRSNKLD